MRKGQLLTCSLQLEGENCSWQLGRWGGSRRERRWEERKKWK